MIETVKSRLNGYWRYLIRCLSHLIGGLRWLRVNLLPTQDALSKLVQTLGWVYGPAIASIVAALLFALSDAVHEIFVILASDTVQFFASVFSGTFGSNEALQLFRIAFSVLGVWMMVSAIWHATRYAIINSPRGKRIYEMPQYFAISVNIDKDLSWTPHVLAAIPVLGLMTGVVSTLLSGEARNFELVVLYIYGLLLFALAIQTFTRSTFRAGQGRDVFWGALKLPYIWFGVCGILTTVLSNTVVLNFLWYAAIAIGTFQALHFAMTKSANKNMRDSPSLLLAPLYFVVVASVLASDASRHTDDVGFWAAYRNSFDDNLALIVTGYLTVTIFSLLLAVPPSQLTVENRKPKTRRAKYYAWAYFSFTVLAIVLTVAFPTIWNIAGPIALGCMFFGAFAYHTSFLSVLSARHMNGIPLNLAWLVLAVLMYQFGQTGLHRAVPVQSAQGIDSFEKAARSWLTERAADDGPIFLIAAQGGGLYAGYHAAYDLGLRSDKDPAFADRVFAISSVSGGSVGAATFWAIRRCSKTPDCADAHQDVTMYRQATRTILERDFLTPVAAGLLYTDLFQAFVPRTDWLVNFERGLTLKYGLGRAIASTLSQTQRDEFYASIKSSSTGTDPLLLINVTRLHDGRNMVFSAVENEDHRLSGQVGQQDVSLGDAVIASARFPVVTPPARMHFSNDKVGVSQLIDGGYFDNTGLEGLAPALEALLKVQQETGNTRKITVISYALDVADPTTRSNFGFLSAPVVGLESTRSSRNSTTSTAFQRRFGDAISFHKCSLSTRDYQLTLSWLLAEATFNNMRHQIEDTVKAATLDSPCGG